MTDTTRRSSPERNALRRLIWRHPSALYEHLSELASTLISHGVTASAFSKLAACAFVDVAAETSTFLNGKVNYSRVAARTGLTRAEVRRLLKARRSEGLTPHEGPLERVVFGWRSDRQFTDLNRRPRVLKISGSRRSFASLVRKYAGDLPHRAVLEELREIGAATTTGDSVRLSARSPLTAPKTRDTVGRKRQLKHSPR